MDYLTHITFKFAHHGSHAGYDLLTNYMPVDKIISRDHFDLRLSCLNHKGLGRINNKLFEYSMRNFQKAVYRNMLQKGGIHHFLYPENTLAFFDYEVPSGVKIVSSFHQPPESYEKMLHNVAFASRVANFRKTDFAIALGEEQVPVLKKLLLHDKIKVVPHGLDLDFFQPAKISAELSKTILIVGNWLRNFDLARQVAIEMGTSNPAVHFIVVSLETNKQYFSDLTNVTFKSNITDLELLALYQSSSLLFLPLKGAIANNALLEALACNLPILVSDLPAFRHFDRESGIRFCQLTVVNSVAALNDLLEESYSLKERGVMRMYGQNYGWSNISLKIADLYLLLH